MILIIYVRDHFNYLFLIYQVYNLIETNKNNIYMISLKGKVY